MPDSNSLATTALLRTNTPVPKPERAGPSPSPSGTRLTQRILIVEDDLQLSEVLGLRLRKLGFNVTCVNSGVRARWNLRCLSYDAVLLDLWLPDLNGTELMSEKPGRRPLPPVFVLTGADREEQSLARHLGARRVFQKPTPFSEISAAIVQSLDR